MLSICSMDPQSKILFCCICLQVIFASVFSDVWKAEVVSEIEVLVTSCVVLPCKFDYPGPKLPDSRVRGIWHGKDSITPPIFDEDQTLIKDSFKGRTKLIGRLGEKNCSLEIDEVKDHDNGPFCFRADIKTLDKYSFVEKCVTINMKYEPDKPNLDHEESFEEGASAIFKCYVRHTCPSHHPIISWSRPDAKARMSYKDNGHGIWEVESLLTFTPIEDDDHTNITCTVTFHGHKTSTASHKLYIKRKANIFHIIIPVAAVLGTTILFGVVCFFVNKRYRRQIQDLQSRNANVVWSRLSRMSRRSHVRHETDTSVATKSKNYENTLSGTAGFSKPRFPSPKSEQKKHKSGDGCSADYDDDYTNLADLSVYGNV